MFLYLYFPKFLIHDSYELIECNRKRNIIIAYDQEGQLIHLYYKKSQLSNLYQFIQNLKKKSWNWITKHWSTWLHLTWNNNPYALSTLPLRQHSNLNLVWFTYYLISGVYSSKLLKKFYMVCSSMKPIKINKEHVKMRAFWFSLVYSANCLHYLLSRLITI